MRVKIVSRSQSMPRLPNYDGELTYCDELGSCYIDLDTIEELQAIVNGVETVPRFCVKPQATPTNKITMFFNDGDELEISVA